ncbi:MAG: VOC family protein, partial [Candidatus Omnitrophica bacterium]|nr:VOC family protein [Candidatus Omnitrophota bacterium]
MKPTQILETCLYVEDLRGSKEYYSKVLGLDLLVEEEGRHLFFRCGETMLLLFLADATEKHDSELDVPTHGSRGRGHCCFTMREEEIDGWKKHLGEMGIDIE